MSTALRKSGFKIIQKIPKATVPIGIRLCIGCCSTRSNQQSSPKVKFKDPNTDIQCDLNINDQLGFINTSLIRHYCDILPVLRPLLLAIKRWARPLGYNSPASAPGVPVTFSSYTLAIMTIGLLQVRCRSFACLITPAPIVLISLRQGACYQIYKRAHNLPKIGYSGCGQRHKKESNVMLGGRKYKIGRHPGRLG